jgi:hypothetical protein
VNDAQQPWLRARARFSGSVRTDLLRCLNVGIHVPQVLHSDIDLLNPPADLEKQKHKLKRLVQSPNSFFMDVKCQGCFQM